MAAVTACEVLNNYTTLAYDVSLDGIVGSKLSAVRPVFTAFLYYYF